MANASNVTAAKPKVGGAVCTRHYLFPFARLCILQSI